MKKILTLVVTLALVFAIAAPALAITGDLTPDETDPKTAPAALDVQLFNAPEALGYGGLALSQIAANKAYVVNEMAFWGIVINFGKSPVNMIEDGDYLGSVLSLTSDAITFNTVVTQYTQVGAADVQKSPASLLTIDNIHNNGATGASALNGFFNQAEARKLFFFGSGLVKTKGVVKAELKKAPTWPMIFINNADGFLYSVDHTIANTFTVTDADGNTVDFIVDPATDFVTRINVNGGEVLFYVPVSNGGSVVKSIGGEEAGDPDFDAWNKVYEGVMKFFGFNYDAEGRLLEKHFESKFSGLYLKDEVVVQLYTSAVVIPGGVEPPKTGDASTVIGFVMIVLAMVACGVVVSRKVRA